ncbi:MAG: sugar ABC transporter permease [Spirochaetales bacterium]|nr:sugar ABC transporter permease [Spirochaetales bacterium]
MSYRKKQQYTVLFAFLFIPTILLLLFVIIPLVKLFEYSFSDWNGITKTYHYIGFDNFIKVFNKMPDVWLSLRNNALYFFIHLFFIPLEIIMAYMIDKKIRGAGLFKTIILLPFIINGVAVSYMFSAFFAPGFVNGALTMILKNLGLDFLVQNWLSDKEVVNYSLVFVSLWRYSGFHIILFLAGLQSIPKELYESAAMDGAGEIRILYHIVLPNIMTVIEIVLFLNVRGALQVFDIPFVMTNGGPGHASSTFTFYTIETAFKFNNIGAASAMAVVLFLLIILISKIQNSLIHGRKFLYDSN